MKRVLLASIAVVALTSSAAMAQSVSNFVGAGLTGSGVSVDAGGLAASGGAAAAGGSVDAYGHSLNGMQGSASSGLFIGGVGANGPAMQTYNTAGVVGYSQTYGGATTAGLGAIGAGFGIGAHDGGATALGGGIFGAGGTVQTLPLDPNDDCSIANQGGCSHTQIDVDVDVEIP